MEVAPCTINDGRHGEKPTRKEESYHLIIYLWMDVAPWCYKYDGVGWDWMGCISRVGVRYRAPYSANNYDSNRFDMMKGGDEIRSHFLQLHHSLLLR